MKRISIFLAITFILTWAYEFGVVYPISSGALVGVPPVAAQFATGAAMFFPALGVLITRLVTREGFKNSLIKPRGFKKSLPWFVVAWFGPALLAAIGAAVYFLAFPQDFDPSMSTIVATQQQAAAAAGAGDVSADQVRAMLLASCLSPCSWAPRSTSSRRSGVIGKKCVQSLIVIHAIRAACMQVIPLHSSAPAPHRFIFFASFGSCSIKLSNQDVRRHFLQDLFRACTGFKVHIAPPERRLDAPRQPQSPMLSQHVRIWAFTPPSILFVVAGTGPPSSKPSSR